MKICPLYTIDSYKYNHLLMYPDNIARSYCNLVPRDDRHFKKHIPDGIEFNKIVAFGMHLTIFNLINDMKETFFNVNFNNFIKEYLNVADPYIGYNQNSRDKLTFELKKLHDLGYLPLEIRSLPEGSVIKKQTPILTIKSTVDGFPWLPNFFETYISQNTWKLITMSSVAKLYKNILTKYKDMTCDNDYHIPFQAHMFGDSGLGNSYDAINAGLAHATQFLGSDSVNSSYMLKNHYKIESSTPIAFSVPATEHSIMQLGINCTNEEDTIKRILEQFNSGIVSIVCDTDDYWNTLGNIIPSLKETILSRKEDENGLCKFLVRLYSGNPVDVICGFIEIKDVYYHELNSYQQRAVREGFAVYKSDKKYYKVLINNQKTLELYLDVFKKGDDGEIKDNSIPEIQVKGTIQSLYDTFGGRKNTLGYIELNSKIGCIYGDSITPQRAKDILERLAFKGFASNNIVLGVGSYSYQYYTRDTLGFGIKMTAAWDYDNNLINVRKNVITDTNKKSYSGLLHVSKTGTVTENCTEAEEADSNELKIIYKDNILEKFDSFDKIKERAGI